MIPATIQVIHAFDSHHNVVSFSDSEHHFHVDELACTLCFLIANTNGVLSNYSYTVLFHFDLKEQKKYYHYYTEQQHLSYSLRAPPTF